MALEWSKLPSGCEMAAGDVWTYLITRDDRNVILTRWDTGPNPAAHEVASQAALYSIQMNGPYSKFPDVAEINAVRLMRMAQQYESGQDVTGQPAWRH